MSETSLPISPARFAAALRDLPIANLHLKAAELRNSIAHLDYSNEQLKPFAFPNSHSAPSEDGVTTTEGDPDCVDAIRENEIVIGRMQERIALLRAEVERRGASWIEFSTAEELDKREEGAAAPPVVNGTAGAHGSFEDGRHEAWRDGTFQTGRISSGDVMMGGVGASGVQTNGAAPSRAQGGSRSDEELRRLLEERMREDADADGDDDGLHL
ncbi:MAG: hypothetical protein M1818_006653 [Claussenomyces sp. TS43310]|nr:MAG: hypothetical protein M1818_006914 [Claussenomyces sp. TS43310]KAI9735076.1 MAG: hypothetical protein M1818_006653 [Claussenomyces sp. TS43310]